MSPVFRHGGLRLYLLKLLDEAPRHGYDVIRLLQDKFLGVYSPSPGTIYPRLARLEEEGLVTHETTDGKKVYRITEAGRAELNRRLDDLADLEEELAASVRDIAREISRDVRETVRNLRDELTWAVREAGRPGGPASSRTRPDAGQRAGAREAAGQDADPGPDATSGTAAAAADDTGTEAAAGQRTRRGRPDWREWADCAAEHGDWREWAAWARRQGWADWAIRQDWRETVRPEQAPRARERRANHGQDGHGEGRESHADLVSDLEHLAAAFASQIRGVARHAENMGDDTIGNLGRILGDALSRIRTEIVRPADHDAAGSPDREPPRRAG